MKKVVVYLPQITAIIELGGIAFGVTALWQRARLKLRYARFGRSEALRAPPLPPLASLRLSREPYATARQFA